MKQAPNKVIIESPLAGDFPRNQRYARWCMLDSLRRGEAPFASHLLYTQMLDDEVPEDRELGILAGFAWGEGVSRVYYVDLCPLTDADVYGDRAVFVPGLSSCVQFSRGMFRAFELHGGESRALALSNPDFWQAFLRGEEPKKTRGAA